MNPLIEDIKRTFASGSALTKIIIINVAVFVVVNLVNLILFLFNVPNSFNLVHWLAAPASLEALLFKPWTVITYMFLHEGFMHLLFNMIFLYFAGQLFISFLGEKKFISTYILGGIAGYLLFMLSYNFFPAFRNHAYGSVLLGASASVMAVFIGIATYIPNFVVRLFFMIEVKLKWVALGYFILDVLNVSGTNAGGALSHIGGAMFGYFMIKSYQQGRGFVLDLAGLKSFLTSLFKPKMKVVSSKRKKSSSTGFSSSASAKPSQEEIDRILDKIAKSGYDSLTKKEKETLFKAK